ncbi:MAG TPA: OmpA family protein [Polyangiaceae bacterium]|jgi:outer membrane protein OmpA-like peptidoglycan-associated protein|nr:OmpA family protein [Polyangiaceae bacterium]
MLHFSPSTRRTSRKFRVVPLFAAVAGAYLSFGRGASAENVRLHATLDVGKALGGFQERELSFGGAGLISAELPLLRQVGADLQISTLLLAKGDPPRDPALLPEGGAHAVIGALGLMAHPFASKDPTKPTKLSGIWASGHFGATTTGGLFRAAADLQTGYDFLFDRGRYGIGPTVGLMHVFQPDSELRPDDANILLFGIHAVYDTAPRIPVELDRDHDGILDEVDACPDVPEDRDGFQDGDGCPDPDNDKDGVLDSVDHCPDIAEDRDGFEDADGCPDPDNDKDGIPDAQDRCPDEAEDVDGFEDSDGCPDPDNDKDGLPDKEDLCPNEPETKNGYADEDGCPDEEQVRVVGQKIVLDDRVNFEQNNARIREVSFPLLERLSRLLKAHPEYIHIEVQGHTDQRGTAEYNRKLSEDRANSVLEFLVKQGVDHGRLNAVGFGSEHLLVDKSNERALYLNRRVEFQITRAPADGGAVPASPPDAATTPAPPPAVAPPPAPAPASATPAEPKVP